MKTVKETLSFLFILLSVSCNPITPVSTKAINLTEAENKNTTAPEGIKVSAYLVYKNGTISTFDVLNTRAVLWNTIIGGGDAENTSEQTKVVLAGRLDSLEMTIYNGKGKVKVKSYRAVIAVMNS